MEEMMFELFVSVLIDSIDSEGEVKSKKVCWTLAELYERRMSVGVECGMRLDRAIETQLDREKSSAVRKKVIILRVVLDFSTGEISDVILVECK